MMKKLILFLIILVSSIYSFQKKGDYFSYNTLGTDLIIPSISMGIREWDRYDGVDLNCSLSSLIYINRLSVSASYLRKFKNGVYVGIGGGLFLVMLRYEDDNYFNPGIYPSLKFGVELENSFHEIIVATPQFSSYGIVYYPLVSYRYGF